MCLCNQTDAFVEIWATLVPFHVRVVREIDALVAAASCVRLKKLFSSCGAHLRASHRPSLFISAAAERPVER